MKTATPKNKKALIIIVVILLFIALVAFFALRKKKTTESNSIKEVTNPETGKTEILTKEMVHPSFFPLQKGSKNDYVTILQRWLKTENASLLPNYGIDGEFGTETEAAVLSVLGTPTVSLEQFTTKILN